MFNNKIEKLALEILENSWEYRKYWDEDMINATIVFMEVFLAKMFDKHSDKLWQEQLEKLATEWWKSLHQTLELFTWIDMKKLNQ